MKQAGLLGDAALVIVLGPFAWEFASRHMEARTFITAEIGAAVAAGGCASSLRPSGTLALLRCLRCLCDRGGEPASALDKYPAVQVSRCRRNDGFCHQLHKHGPGVLRHASCRRSRHGLCVISCLDNSCQHDLCCSWLAGSPAPPSPYGRDQGLGRVAGLSCIIYARYPKWT